MIKGKTLVSEKLDAFEFPYASAIGSLMYTFGSCLCSESFELI